MDTRPDFRKLFFICTLMLASSMALFAQQAVWSPVKSLRNVQAGRAVQRQSFPRDFKLFSLNREGLEQKLFSAIDRPGQSTVVTLPNADGSLEQFELFEASNFEPE